MRSSIDRVTITHFRTNRRSFLVITGTMYVSLSEETTIMFDELMAQSLMAAAAHRVSGQSKKWGGQES